MKKSNDTPDIIFGEIYDKYRRDAVQVALNVLKDPHLAEDACQMAFIYIAQHLEQATNNPEKTHNYVVKVTHHFAIDVHRKRKHILTHEIPIIDDAIDDSEGQYGIHEREVSMDSFEDMLIGPDNLAEVMEAMEKLKGDDAVYVKEYFLDELTMKEIASIHGISDDNAKKKVYRAIEKLRRMLVKQEGGRNE